MQHRNILGTACVVLLSAGVMAQPQNAKPLGDKPAPRADQVTPQQAMTPVEAPAVCRKGSEVIGAKVRNAEYGAIGKVEDLVVDPTSGVIDFAVLSLEDQASKNKWYAVPFEMLSTPTPMAANADAAAKRSVGTEFILKADVAKLQSSPGFTHDKWPDVNSPAWRLDLDRHFGVVATGDAPRDGDVIAEHRSIRLSELLKKDITTKTDEKLGDVKELAVDTRNGRVAFVVVSTGGFLGIGDTLHAIPWDAVTTQSLGGEDRLTIDVTKERLKNAPEFKADQWARMSESAWVSELYKYYGYKPHGAQDAKPRDTKVTPPKAGGTDREMPKGKQDKNGPQ